MRAFGPGMNARKFLVWQVSSLLLFGALFAVSTAFLRSATCIEGGTVLGYPRCFYARCYEAGPGSHLGTVFELTSLLIDIAFWYLLSTGLALAGILVFRRLRGGRTRRMEESELQRTEKKYA